MLTRTWHTFSHLTEVFIKMTPQPQRVAVAVPPGTRAGLWPFIVTCVLVGIEVAVAFIDLIVQAAGGAKNTKAMNLLKKGLLSAAVINFHMTWCIPFSLTLTYIVSSLSWSMGRKKCSLFPILNGIACFLFLGAAIYSWMWANDAEIMLQICKNLLIPLGLKKSPEQLRLTIYTTQIKTLVDIMVSWAYPAQCAIVLTDAFLAICRRGTDRIIHLLVRVDKYDKIHVKMDPYDLIAS
ncbi:Putative membrane spanning protein [Giardia duodenalis]|uniref:Uncharacterized protein n=2 Tax=Giardia intestinalis TaxID=5741 RepID=C6LPG3_GIAIB|nr:Hypothetical protein GL50581_628 [Giardia intestinalis ATCC 50581]ESU41327.1 Putative membrane spanning protein [Giardia intestinalis]